MCLLPPCPSTKKEPLSVRGPGCVRPALEAGRVARGPDTTASPRRQNLSLTSHLATYTGATCPSRAHWMAGAANRSRDREHALSRGRCAVHARFAASAEKRLSGACATGARRGDRVPPLLHGTLLVREDEASCHLGRQLGARRRVQLVRAGWRRFFLPPGCRVVGRDRWGCWRAGECRIARSRADEEGSHLAGSAAAAHIVVYPPPSA